eukprot:3666778-Pleurochrysis_carterae.AAC.1
MRRGVRGEERRLAPVLVDDRGEPWRKERLDRAFHAWLVLCFGEETAKKYSVHSFRIYLACALRAAGASESLIMEMLRWSTADAL